MANFVKFNDTYAFNADMIMYMNSVGAHNEDTRIAFAVPPDSDGIYETMTLKDTTIAEVIRLINKSKKGTK